MKVNADCTCELADAMGIRVHYTDNLAEVALWLPEQGILLIDRAVTHHRTHEALERALMAPGAAPAQRAR